MWACWVPLIVCGIHSGVAEAQPPDIGRRVPVGKMVSAPGTLLQRPNRNTNWKVLPANAAVSTGDSLLALPGSRGTIEVKDGAVQLSVWGNVPEFFDFPLLESVVQLNNPLMGRDFEFTLDRGRVLLTKVKGTEPVNVAIRFRERFYELILAEPGTEVAMELIARWTYGSPPFSTEPKPDDLPTVAVMLFVIKGQANLKLGDEQFLMRAPSSFRWDNIVGLDRRPQDGTQLPSWATEKTLSTEAKAMQAAVDKLQKMLTEQSVEKALAAARSSPDANMHKLAVYGFEAIDDLPMLMQCFADSKNVDVRETAIRAARHWIAQGSRQNLTLYYFLTNQFKYNPNQAETLLHLLHSFSDADRDRPETYETLIEYLRHDLLPVRELARWHLYRFVIAGRGIPYDPAGSPAELEKAVQAWKQLIPTGKLPPRAKPSGK